MRKNRISYWTYKATLPKPKPGYTDPRIAVARHIGWQKISGEETTWTVPEPDNYNRCFVVPKPVECKFIEDQVIYRGRHGWVTLLVVPEEQMYEFDLWVKRLKPLAHWRHTRPPKMKTYIMT